MKKALVILTIAVASLQAAAISGPSRTQKSAPATSGPQETLPCMKGNNTDRNINEAKVAARAKDAANGRTKEYVAFSGNGSATN